MGNSVDPYLFPARGRKQSISQVRSKDTKMYPLIPTFSPQGDGNLWVPGAPCNRQWLELIPTFSPQGDGNHSLILSSPTPLVVLIPTFSPQGDGNDLKPVTSNWLRSSVDPYLFPARGRKPELSVSWANVGLIIVDPYLFPARGRKLHGSLKKLAYLTS